MPTTQPLDPGDDAEGQLKPIADFATVRSVAVNQTPTVANAAVHPAVPAQTPTPVSTPAATVVQQARTPAAHTTVATPTPTPVVGTTIRGMRTSLKTPRLTLSGRVDDATGSPAQVQAAQVRQDRRSPFEDSAVVTAWHQYAVTHPSEHVLANAMRASIPVRLDGGDTFAVAMVNNIQVDEVNKHLADILAVMRTALDNDNFDIRLRVSDGPADPSTWNEQEVLTHMLKNNRPLADFINAFDLKL